MVCDFLEIGKEHARTAKELCEAMAIGPRELTEAISEERRSGQPICASSDPRAPGYFLAAHREEMAQYCSSLDHRVTEVKKTLRACRKTIDRLPEPAPDSRTGG